jgi:hypothetical protein
LRIDELNPNSDNQHWTSRTLQSAFCNVQCAAYNPAMQCRQCGTEIADKAIVCFRCGAATTDPVRKAVPVKSRRTGLVSAVIIIALLVVAAALWQASRTAANPELPQLAAGLVLGAAIVVLLLRVLRRR